MRRRWKLSAQLWWWARTSVRTLAAVGAVTGGIAGQVGVGGPLITPNRTARLEEDSVSPGCAVLGAIGTVIWWSRRRALWWLWPPASPR